MILNVKCFLFVFVISLFLNVYIWRFEGYTL